MQKIYALLRGAEKPWSPWLYIPLFLLALDLNQLSRSASLYSPRIAVFPSYCSKVLLLGFGRLERTYGKHVQYKGSKQAEHFWKKWKTSIKVRDGNMDSLYSIGEEHDTKLPIFCNWWKNSLSQKENSCEGLVMRMSLQWWLNLADNASRLW